MDHIVINLNQGKLDILEDVEYYLSPKSQATTDKIMDEIWDNLTKDFYMDECYQIFARGVYLGQARR